MLDALGAWGQRWGKSQFEQAKLDVGVLMWNLRRGLDVSKLPPGRTVVRFDFRGVAAQSRGMRTWWLVLHPPEVDICLKDPGFDVDLAITADTGTIARVWMGQVDFAQAVRAGGVRLEGPSALVRAFPRWLRMSEYARVPAVVAKA